MAGAGAVIEFAGTIGRHGRWCLIAGLVAGLTLPGLAEALRPWLPEMIGCLLFVAAFRIGPHAALGGFGRLRETLRTVLFFQLAAPLAVLVLALALGVAATPWALAAVLVLAAPPVTGSPNFTILLRADPAIAMRLLLVGTAVFPLTAIPILALSPATGTFEAVFAGAFRLLAVIAGAVGLAFLLRVLAGPSIEGRHRDALDGLAAVLLGVVVVGLMSAAGPALEKTPVLFALWLAFAFALNIGAQILAAMAAPVVRTEDRPGAALVAGNRNVALFLVALPEHVMDDILLFIACYQIPMYLTPILMRRILTRDWTRQGR